MLWPAARESGSEIPLTVNSVVLILAPETVTPDPLAVSVAVKLLLCPTVTLPKFRVAGLTANWPETLAVPAREMVSWESEASETTEIDPEALPPEVGVKTAPKVKLCPGLRLKGKFNPVTRKPVPETLAWLMVTLEPPVLVSVSDWVALPLIATLPKSRLESLVLRTPAVAVLAISGIVSVLLVALLATERLPVDDPPWGVKVTLNVVLWPGARVAGRFKPVTVKAGAETFAAVMVTLVPPELLSFSEIVLGLPACTAPKARFDGDDVSDPAARPVAASGMPSEGFEASLAMEREPLAGPSDCGL